MTLTPGTQYNFIAEVDSESSGVDSIPEPWTVMLMLTGLCLILARRRLSER